MQTIISSNFQKIFVFICFGIIVSCSANPKISRVAYDKTLDISGRWNDTDSRLVSAAMVEDCANHPWLTSYINTHSGKKPDIIVGTVVNCSHEHINIQTFMKDLERALLNTGRVNFVAAPSERQEIRQEREDMAEHASDESFKGPGHEAGADFILKGNLTSIIDEAGGKRVVFYQVNLELYDMLTNYKVWIGEKKIKKIITRPSLRW